jgi:hypothetical protein
MLKNKSEDVFYENESPEMIKELLALGVLTAHTPVYFKAEIIISFLKNHSLKNKWIEANPVLAELMISGSSVTTHLESLFESARGKKDFLLAYESYIKTQILNSEKAYT